MTDTTERKIEEYRAAKREQRNCELRKRLACRRTTEELLAALCAPSASGREKVS